MPEVTDWNSKIIAEFRANGGRVGGQFEGAPLLLLHTVGAKSGQERVNPMMYRARRGQLRRIRLQSGCPDESGLVSQSARQSPGTGRNWHRDH